MKINEAMRYHRKRCGLTQSELGARLDPPVQDSAIAKMEKGDRKIKFDYIQQMCKIFGCSVSDFSYNSKSNINLSMTAMSCMRVPVFGSVRAGIPFEMNDEIVDYIPVHAPKAANHFGVKVIGDSMEPVIMEGDTLLVHSQPDIENGEIAVVSVDGSDATVKKVKKTDSGIMLIAINQKYDPMFFTAEDDVRILGKVVEVRRTL